MPDTGVTVGNGIAAGKAAAIQQPYDIITLAQVGEVVTESAEYIGILIPGGVKRYQEIISAAGK